MHSVSLRFVGRRNNQKKEKNVEKNMKERLVKELDENNTVVSYKWKRGKKNIYKNTFGAGVTHTLYDCYIVLLQTFAK